MASSSDADAGDSFLDGQLRIRQAPNGAKAGLDAVFLGQATPITAERVLDVGAGAGIVGLIAARRAPQCLVTAIEIDAELAALAQANASANGLATRYETIVGDVTAPFSHLVRLGLRREAYEHILCNPPFGISGAGEPAKTAQRERAHAMPADGFERWARFFASAAAPGGVLTLIHRADALGAILPALGGRFGGLEVLPLHAYATEPAIRVLVRGRKGSRAPLLLRPAFVLHEAGGAWTADANAVLTGTRTVFD
jgi:tRNA1(Val) A37 N6-methylase TrmN6